MPTIWDLMPASLWPVQPFTPPVDPARASTWAQAVPPSWYPSGDNAASPDWPMAPAGSAAAPPYGRALSWDSPTGAWLPPPNGAPRVPDVGSAAPRVPDVGSAAYYDQMLADAKGAHAFVKWLVGPPTAPQAGAGGNAAPSIAASASQPGGALDTAAASQQRSPATFWNLLPPTPHGAPFVPVVPTTDQLDHYFPPITPAPPVTPGAQHFFADAGAGQAMGNQASLGLLSPLFPAAASEAPTAGEVAAGSAAAIPAALAAIMLLASTRPAGERQSELERRRKFSAQSGYPRPVDTPTFPQPSEAVAPETAAQSRYLPSIDPPKLPPSDDPEEDDSSQYVVRGGESKPRDLIKGVSAEQDLPGEYGMSSSYDPRLSVNQILQVARYPNRMITWTRAPQLNALGYRVVPTPILDSAKPNPLHASILLPRGQTALTEQQAEILSRLLQMHMESNPYYVPKSR